jgi:hypothetical protein
LPGRPSIAKTAGIDDATFYADKVELMLSDGRSLSLPQVMSASGARYANKDESFVFWNKGNYGLYHRGRSGQRDLFRLLDEVTSHTQISGLGRLA